MFSKPPDEKKTFGKVIYSSKNTTHRNGRTQTSDIVTDHNVSSTLVDF